MTTDTDTAAPRPVEKQGQDPDTLAREELFERMRAVSVKRFEEQAEKKASVALRMAASVLDRSDLGIFHVLNRCLRMEKRLAELEKQPFAYDGPHEQGKTYSRGMFVTHDGSLWHANYKTASRPGDGPAWTLAVKRGRDAR